MPESSFYLGQVVEHDRCFRARVDAGLAELNALLEYVKARSSAELAYAAAVERAAEFLGPQSPHKSANEHSGAAAEGVFDVFFQVDLGLVAPKVTDDS